MISKKYYVKNKEHVLSVCKNYYAENKGVISVKAQAYREKNKRKISCRIKKWWGDNHEKRSVYKNNYRARKLDNGGTHNYLDIKALILSQKSKCKYCEAELILTGCGKYHVDHRMPLKLGGSNSSENLQLLCKTCNLKKGAIDPDKYEERIGFKNN